MDNSPDSWGRGPLTPQALHHIGQTPQQPLQAMTQAWQQSGHYRHLPMHETPTTAPTDTSSIRTHSLPKWIASSPEHTNPQSKLTPSSQLGADQSPAVMLVHENTRPQVIC